MWDRGEHLLPVKAIQRAYRAASRRQRDITSRPQVTVREMMPRMMKKSVVIHSGGSCGGMQMRSRPWMVWHCCTRPTVREPVERQRGAVVYNNNSAPYIHASLHWHHMFLCGFQDMMTSQESLWLPTWARGTCWYGDTQRGGVPAAATMSPSDSCTTSNKLSLLAGTTKATQKETAKLTAKTKTRRSVTSHQMANHLTALLPHKPAGRSDVRYRGGFFISHIRSPPKKERLHRLNCASSPPNTEHINAKLNPPTPSFILLFPSLFSYLLSSARKLQSTHRRRLFHILWIYGFIRGNSNQTTTELT